MAGNHPEMVIRVAADLAGLTSELGAAVSAVENTAAEMGGLEGAVADTVSAYDTLGRAAPADLAAVESATEEVDSATTTLSGSIVAFGTFVGTLAADLAGEVFKVVWKSLQQIGEALLEISGAREIVATAWAGVRTELELAFKATGVVEAGLQTLGTALLEAFGVTKQQAIANLVKWITDFGIAGIGAGIQIADFAAGVVRMVGLMAGPIDVLTVGFVTLVERINAGVSSVVSLAAQMPGVGQLFAGAAAQAQADAAAWGTYRDRANDAMAAHDALARGAGPVHDSIAAIRGALERAEVAMKSANAEAGATVDAYLRGGGAMAEYAGQAGAAIPITRDFSEQVRGVSMAYEALKAPVDDVGENVRIFDTDLIGVIPTLTDFSTTLVALKPGIEDNNASLNVLNDTLADTGPAMDDAGERAKKAGAEFHFAAEVVQEAALSWSEAMDLVRQGQGTMTGTIGPAVKPAGMTDQEFAQMQNDPRQWELLHGWDWQHPGGTGGSMRGLAGFNGGGGSTTTQNINVSTVMGDKHEIARVVKDALGEEWRASGRRA